MSKPDKKKKTMKIPIILSVILSITFIVVILYLTIKPEYFAKITEIKIRYEFFIVAILLNFLSWCIWGLRLKILSNVADKKVKISWWKSTKIVLANLFLAGITPSMAGGEPIRIYLLRKEGMSTGCATASALGERLLDAIFFLACVPFALFILRNNLAELGDSSVGIALSVGIVIFLLAILIFFYAVLKPKKVKSFLIWVNKKLDRFFKNKEKGKKVVERINCEVDNFHKSMMTFLKTKKNAFVKSGIVTIIMWLTGWLVASMVLFGLGITHNIIYSMAAQVFLIIIIMMPTTPGSSGVTELGSWGLYGFIIRDAIATYGHPLATSLGNEQALLVLMGIFVVIYRLITYHMNLIVGAIFQFKAFKSVASFSTDMIEDKENNTF